MRALKELANELNMGTAGREKDELLDDILQGRDSLPAAQVLAGQKRMSSSLARCLQNQPAAEPSSPMLATADEPEDSAGGSLGVRVFLEAQSCHC